MGEYIKPAQAYKKLDAAKLLKQGVYMYSSSGFGKTELIRQYLKKQQYIYILCQQNYCDLSVIPDDYSGTVVIDNVNSIESNELRNDIAALTGRQGIWLIIAGRSRMPSWLFDSFIRRNMMLISEEDIALSPEGINKFMRSEGIILSADEIQYEYKTSHGNMMGLIYTAQMLKSGEKLSDNVYQKVLALVLRYFEDSVIAAMNTEIVDMLMKLSVTEDFTENLAMMLTGNSAIFSVIEQAMDAGNFLEKNGDVYSMRPEMLMALRNKAAKEFTPDELRQYALIAGAYYETSGEDNKALELYAKHNEKRRIKELLLRNSRRNPESGYFIEMKKYYLMLSDEDISSNAYLMSAVSLVYSMMMDFEKSEYWYDQLVKYKNSVKGAKYREAVTQQAYLDIALPGRGSQNILELIKSCYTILSNKSIPMPEFSVTSNQPSLMNGGKDFCEWSKHDRKIAATAGKIVCAFLGKYGKGLVNAALGESFFEKGEDPYEVLAMCSSARLESEAGGKLELRFAATAVMIRQHIMLGNPAAAKDILNSFERTVKAEKTKKLLPSIEAMRCRIALMEGDPAAVEQWLLSAPDEDEEFIGMERYRYLTKIRCYIRSGELGRACSLIASVKYYAEKCDRKYIQMELSLLEAIVRQRSGKNWERGFIKALEVISSYHFIPIISREGAAIYELLMQSREKCFADKNIDRKWLETVIQETGRVARRYPLYLKTDAVSAVKVSPMDTRILACLADGLSVQKTAEILGLNFETLRSRIKDLYRRLGVKNKTEAVMVAMEMKLI